MFCFVFHEKKNGIGCPEIIQKISCNLPLNLFINAADVWSAAVAESGATGTARWGMVALMARACGRELMVEFLRVSKRR